MTMSERGARVLLTCAYWWGGIAKLTDFSGAVREVAAFALPQPALVAALTIALEVAASLAVIAGRGSRVACAALALFTLAASCLANPFWALAGEARFHALNAFLEHLGLIGGFLLVALADARKASA
jgi:uncharacterized membrane protein YphA (DoxX/SURF4 family)